MSEQYGKQKTLEAIQGSGGIVSTIAKRLGCSWYTAKKLTTRWPDAERAYIDEKEHLLDLAETTLLTAIKNGDIQEA